MPRKLRVQYEGAIYHVMNRGDRREPIFLDDKDWEMFLATLGQACGSVAEVGEVARMNQNGTLVPGEAAKQNEYSSQNIPSTVVPIPK